MFNVLSLLRIFQSKMIMQVRDELVFEVQKSEGDEVKELVKQEMERMIKLHVAIKVDAGVSDLVKLSPIVYNILTISTTIGT